MRAPASTPGNRRHGGSRGFTLIELIITIVIFSALALVLVLFYRPVVDGFLGSRTRSGLAAEADEALRLMLRDVRLAVPNSLRTPATNCFELVPTSGGGRFRQGLDTTVGTSAALDTSTSSASWNVANNFDVLTPLASTPAVGDWVVVDNQNPGDVYSGANRAAITAVSTPAASLGKSRIAVTAGSQFPLGYDGGRFTLVPNAQQAVFYVCSGASSTLDSQGNAPGVLYRLKAYGFNAAAPTVCPATAGADVVATQVRSCRFLYDPNQGATQQSGFISIQLELTRNSETASLVMGAHVVNIP